MSNWQMLTLVGEDRPGIVARVSDALYLAGWTLGEASMLRLGGNFAIMMMVSGSGDIESILAPVAAEMELHLHVDEMAGGLHQHLLPNVQVRVAGADRTGIVAQVTGALSRVGFNILALESDVAGTQENPVYIMHIQGYADATLETLQGALSDLGDVDVSIAPIETLIG